jgi:hypothetical protein
LDIASTLVLKAKLDVNAVAVLGNERLRLIKAA